MSISIKKIAFLCVTFNLLYSPAFSSLPTEESEGKKQSTVRGNAGAIKADDNSEQSAWRVLKIIKYVKKTFDDYTNIYYLGSW